MAEHALAPDAVSALPMSAAAAVAFRAGGRLHVTVIAKASFAFEPGGDMRRIEPQPIVVTEAHHDNNPTRSVRTTSDLAPYVPGVDVLFVGHAYDAYARLVVLRDDVALVDKTVLIHRADRSGPEPLVYERAFGGLGVAENPFGVGEAQGSAQPSVVDPREPRRPAGFGPISRAWPSRRRLLGATPRRALEGPVAEIPDAFDWSYFHAAPPDQRVSSLRGDEWLLLEGVHPSWSLLRTRLPNARGEARIFGLAEHGVALDLELDTLRIEGDEERVTLVFRRSFPVAGDEALAAVRAVVGVRSHDEALVWIEPRARAERVERGTVEPSTADERSNVTTLVMKPEGASVAGETLAITPSSKPVERALPFQAGAPRLPLPEAPPVRMPTGTLADISSADVLTEVTDTAWPPNDTAPPPIPSAPSKLSSDIALEDYFLPLFEAPIPALDAARAESDVPRVDPSEVTIERYAAIAAAIAEQRAPRASVLDAERLDEDRWRAVDRRWSGAIKKDGKHGAGKLMRAYDAAYVAAVEGFRGPITALEYARLAIAVERRKPEEELDALRIQRPALMSVIRIWAKRLSADARLRNEVSAERARLLAEEE